MLTIYKASAGSGKTFTLTYEYIKTLLSVRDKRTNRKYLNLKGISPLGRQPNRHRAILAITFTNAATKEMKQRIVASLAEIAAGAPSGTAKEYCRMLTDELACTEAQLQEAAEPALAEMLYDYGGFNVSTIDAFFQTVLRTFAREIDHQGDFELQLDTRTMITQCIGTMLDELNHVTSRRNSRLIKWISDYTLGLYSSGKSFNFFNREGNVLRSLTKNISKALDETYGTYAGDLREYYAKPERIDQFDRALHRAIKDLCEPIQGSAVAFLKHFEEAGYTTEQLQSVVRKGIEEAARGEMPPMDGATVRKVLTGENAPSTLANKSKLAKGAKAQAAALDAMAPLLDELVELCRTINIAGARAGFYKELRQALGQLEFFCLVMERLDEYLREHNTILISNTTDLLAGIISESEVPFIYERLGTTLETLLIDEFQDTSGKQWENLKPLVSNSIANGYDNLIIGDVKQAIYHFRNSDSRLLDYRVQTEHFPSEHTLRGFVAAENTNYRSAAGVVRFNNALFRRIATLNDLGSYANVVQVPADTKKSAYVTLKFGSGDKDERLGILEEMAREIKRQHDQGGYPWHSIVVLVRRRKEAAEVVQYLSDYHPEIALLSSEALLLSASPAVRTIMSLLNLVENSYNGNRDDDGEHKFASRNQIALFITRCNYFTAKGMSGDEAIASALDPNSTFPELDRDVDEIRAQNPATLVALIEAIIACKIPPEQRSAQQAYITALQDLAIEHTEGADPSVRAFLDAYNLNLNRWTIKASDELDAVEVMTVHKSKGLERDCVHIPFADWELQHNKQELWLPICENLPEFDPEIVPPILRLTAFTKSKLYNAEVSPFASDLAREAMLERMENINTLYVAFTRAVRELCIHSTGKGIGKLLVDSIETPLSNEADEPSLLPLNEFYDAATRSYVQGEPTTYIPSTKAKEARVTIYPESYPVEIQESTSKLLEIDDIFNSHIDIGDEAPKDIVDDPIVGRAMQHAADRGNLLHAILAATRTLADLPAAAESVGRRARLSEPEIAEYVAELNAAIESGGDLVAGWFAPENTVHAERAVYDSHARRAWRPDRVIVQPDGHTVVIDYKFTSEAQSLEKARDHHDQVANYLRLLRALGHKEVRGYLWYPLLHEVKKVD